MWEEWRAEIDRSLRDAQLTETRWYDRDFRAELREDAEEAHEGFRPFSVITTAKGQAQRDLPRSWHLRLDASRLRMRPVL